MLDWIFRLKIIGNLFEIYNYYMKDAMVTRYLPLFGTLDGWLECYVLPGAKLEAFSGADTIKDPAAPAKSHVILWRAHFDTKTCPGVSTFYDVVIVATRVSVHSSFFHYQESLNTIPAKYTNPNGKFCLDKQIIAFESWTLNSIFWLL